MTDPRLFDLQTPISGTKHTLSDFWRWAYSDVLSNRNRSILAEFLVASALDSLAVPRKEWDIADVRYKGKLIEVKASAYLQSWKQSKLSAIKFDIAKKKSWNYDTNTSENEIRRNAHRYVFALFASTDPASANVLDVAQWKFFVVPTSLLETKFSEGKSLTLKHLEGLVTPVGHDELRAAVNRGLEA